MSSLFNYFGKNRATSGIPPHILNAPNAPIIQRSVPVRYDPRVVVKPSPPHRVPHLPVQILYLVAQALPQPKWVSNLARVDKESWVYLQPALYECEVTYEARIAHKLPDSAMNAKDVSISTLMRGECTIRFQRTCWKLIAGE